MLKKLKRLRKLTASALAVALAVSMGLSANVFADSAPDGDVQEPAVTEEPTAETEDPTVETEEPAETEDADNQPEIEAKPTGLTILTMAPFGGYVEPEGESAVTGFSGQALAARYSSASLENYELNSTINLKGSSDIFTWPSASPKVLTYDLLDGVTVNCIVSQGDLQVIQAQANYQSEDNFYVTIGVADRSLNEAEPFALSVSLTVLDKDGNPVTGAETTVRGTFYGNNILPMHTMDDGAYLTSGDKHLHWPTSPG